MGIPPGELKRRTTSEEFVSLIAYKQIMISREQREDIRHADLMSLIANVVSSKNKSFSPKDFMREWMIESQPIADTKSDPALKASDSIRSLGSIYGATRITPPRG